MSDDRINILYIAEFVTGGSVESLHSLVTGIDKTRYCPTVLFYHEPASDIRWRFEEAGATIVILFPGPSDEGSASETSGFNFQAKIRKLLGRHVEGLYASLKYLYTFLRYKTPAYRALRHQFSTLPIDIVHFNNGMASDMPGILAAARSKLPVICHVRAFSHHTPLHVWASRFVSRFLCVSNAIREDIIGIGVDPSQTVICYDSVNQQRFRKTEVDRTKFLSEFGWSPSNKVFAVIGRLDSWKGHDYFIGALDIARRADPDVRGLIVGDITPTATNQVYVSDLNAQIEKLDLDSYVAFTGHRTNVPEIIQCLDAVICASSSPEPFGLMVVESMAVGTPVIATNAGGPAEMISDGKDGLLVPLRDADAMAAAILRIANEEGLAGKLSEAGERTVASRFTVAHHVENVCSAYDYAMGHKS